MAENNKAVFRVVIDGSIDAVWRELTKQGEPHSMPGCTRKRLQSVRNCRCARGRVNT